MPKGPSEQRNSSMAQLVERAAVNRKVRGSNPRGGVVVHFLRCYGKELRQFVVMTDERGEATHRTGALV